MGKEVVSILLKKRMAVQGQMESRNKEIMAHIERVNAVNARYQLLRGKLDQEWGKEIHALDEDKIYALRSYKELEKRRDEIEQKLEQYKIKDENLTLDRWSLDSHLYFKK
jgi:chromosome segregation ATPase